MSEPEGYHPLLAKEIIRKCHRHKPTKGVLVGEFAKGPKPHLKSPEWMRRKAFDGQRWVDLPIHERKYILRKTLKALLDCGTLQLEPKKSVTRNQTIMRLKVASVLELIAYGVG